MTMLMSAVFAQIDCSEANWKEYFNSENRDMTDCDLPGAILEDDDIVVNYHGLAFKLNQE